MAQRTTEGHIVIESTLRLLDYIESEEYKGYDPYDALKSPLFMLPVLRSNKLIRFGAQQLVKRSRMNLRPLLAIPKGFNPVTLGLCIQGYSYLYNLSLSPSPCHPFSLSSPEVYLNKIKYLITELQTLVPKGFHSACWGYDFPWEARYASIRAYQPTVVATGIITNALFEAYKIAGISNCADLIKSSALFVLKDLNKTYHNGSFIFSYSPFDKQQVFNASMKGARILAQAYSISGDDSMNREAKKAVEFVISQQRENGSWGYSLADGGQWTDNYHTGYVLDCLHEYSRLCNDYNYEGSMSKGFTFYRENFIHNDGMPGFYHNDKYPVDTTAAAQTILTLVKFGDVETARRVALWMLENMQDKQGYFYYRKYRNYTEKMSFMRWSNAWMFAALSRLLCNIDTESETDL